MVSTLRSLAVGITGLSAADPRFEGCARHLRQMPGLTRQTHQCG